MDKGGGGGWPAGPDGLAQLGHGPGVFSFFVISLFYFFSFFVLLVYYFIFYIILFYKIYK